MSNDHEVIRVSPTEAHAKMKDEGFTYVDVRAPEEVFEGRPEGAVNVPLGDDDAQFVGAMEKAFTKDKPIVVGCEKGGRSLRAATLLLNAGFTRVIDQRAGWDGARGPFGEVTEPGWSRVGLPYEIG